ncbi:MAG: two-component system, OmpR family, response regulator [Acidobacteriota bacterium]|nr:two-component system, OmpR family, response regulator [Acidobacteriota bacterium]
MADIAQLKKIMYVEDDPDLRKIVAVSLAAKGGFIVQVCDSGEQALKQVGEFQPDLIIMDVIMEEMDGLETLGELRKLPEAEAIPVFFMTSRVFPKDVENYKKIGADGVIKKPFHPLTLADEVKELWKQI